jgi:nucleotide-binding universal stress UspA family protein
MPVPYKHVVVPVDFSDPSKRALDEAIGLVGAFGAKLTLVHVYEPPGYAYAGMTYAAVDLLTPIRDAAKQLLDETLAEARKRVPAADAVLRCGTPWYEIVAVAKEVGADLVVMGTHGRTGLSHALLGSVAEKVLRHAEAPVLAVHPAK